jgi:hypothetical protein
MPQVLSGFKNLGGQGTLRMAVCTVTHTGVTTSTLTTADHGFKNIEFVVANNRTSEAQALVQKNTDSGGAKAGSIYTTSVVSGDVVDYLIFGN